MKLTDVGQALAHELSESDAGQAFGIRTPLLNKEALYSPKNWGELALRISHLIPMISFFGGAISLVLAGDRIRKQGMEGSNQDWAEVARAILAITQCHLLLGAIDIGTTLSRRAGPGPLGHKTT